MQNMFRFGHDLEGAYLMSKCFSVFFPVESMQDRHKNVHLSYSYDDIVLNALGRVLFDGYVGARHRKLAL